MPYLYRCFDKDTKETVYIGSSTQAWLSGRVCSHRFKYNNKPSTFHRYMLENKGWDGYDFEIIKEFDSITKMDLLYQERKYIEEMKPVCNIQTPIVTREEEMKKNRERYYKNKEEWNKKRNERTNCPHCQKDLSRSSLRHHVKVVHHEVEDKD